MALIIMGKSLTLGILCQGMLILGVKIHVDSNATLIGPGDEHLVWGGWFSEFLKQRVEGSHPGNAHLPLVFFYVDKKKDTDKTVYDFDSEWESHYRYNLGAHILGEKATLGKDNSRATANMKSNGLPLLRSFAMFARTKNYDGTIIISTHSGYGDSYTRAGFMSGGGATFVSSKVQVNDIVDHYLLPALQNPTVSLKRVIFMSCSAGIRKREQNGKVLFVPWNEARHIAGTSLVDRVLTRVKGYVDAGVNGGHMPEIYGANGFVYTELVSGGGFTFTIHTKYESMKTGKPKGSACEKQKNDAKIKKKDPFQCDMTLMPQLGATYNNIVTALDQVSTSNQYLVYKKGGVYDSLSLGSRKNWKDYNQMHAFLKAEVGSVEDEEAVGEESTSSDASIERENVQGRDVADHSPDA